MNHHFTPARPGRPTVLALHGRGGCERQLLGLLRAADRSLGVIAPRGQVAADEGYSWSRRYGVGMPIPADLRRRAGELGRWLDRALPGLGVAAPLALVGYSNGAIMAVALAALRPDLVASLALLRGAYPLPWLSRERGLRGMPIRVHVGADDGLLPSARSAYGVRLLRAAGAEVEVTVHAGLGHGLGLADGRDLRAWLADPRGAACRAVPPDVLAETG